LINSQKITLSFAVNQQVPARDTVHAVFGVRGRHACRECVMRTHVSEPEVERRRGRTAGSSGRRGDRKNGDWG